MRLFSQSSVLPQKDVFEKRHPGGNDLCSFKKHASWACRVCWGLGAKGGLTFVLHQPRGASEASGTPFDVDYFRLVRLLAPGWNCPMEVLVQQSRLKPFVVCMGGNL